MTSIAISNGIEQRRRTERRSASVSPFSRAAWQGRRRGAQRAEERVNSYVDWYEPRLLYVAVGILLLCCTDAAFTLNLLQHGASEANPFMAWLLEIDTQLFLVTKFALTAAGLVFLVAHKNFLVFNRFTVRHTLHGLLFGYALLIQYELVLLGELF